MTIELMGKRQRLHAAASIKMLAHKRPHIRIQGILKGIDAIERPQFENVAGMRQEGIHDSPVLLGQQGAGGIQQLAANPYAAGTLAEHGKLKLRQVAINLTGIETPRDLGMATHGAHAGTGRIDEHGVE